MSKFSRKIVNVLGSKKFFYFILTLFIFEAAWIALTAAYPMAFDEDFHLGIIKIYASHINPFFTHQPANSDKFGELTRNPSYFYQYLMSFPYRFLSYFIHSQTVIVIILRFFSIAFFASAILILRRVFIKYIKVSSALTHTVLLFFVLTPTIPLIASQINYDNLLNNIAYRIIK